MISFRHSKKYVYLICICIYICVCIFLVRYNVFTYCISLPPASSRTSCSQKYSNVYSLDIILLHCYIHKYMHTNFHLHDIFCCCRVFRPYCKIYTHIVIINFYFCSICTYLRIHRRAGSAFIPPVLSIG